MSCFDWEKRVYGKVMIRGRKRVIIVLDWDEIWRGSFGEFGRSSWWIVFLMFCFFVSGFIVFGFFIVLFSF